MLLIVKIFIQVVTITQGWFSTRPVTIKLRQLSIFEFAMTGELKK